MSLDPDDIFERKSIFESVEEGRDSMEVSTFESVHERISESSFHIRFFYTLIRDRETRSHEDLIEILVFSSDFSDFFLTEDIDSSSRFRDDFDWFLEWSEKYTFSEHTWRVYLTDLMKSTEGTHRPDSIPSRFEDVEIMIGLVIDDDIPLYERPRWYLVLRAEWEYRGEEVFAEHGDLTNKSM